MNEIARLSLRAVAIACVLFPLAWIPVTARATQTAADAATDTVACRVLEVHTSEQPAVTVAVFHQRDKQDQPRLSALLQKNSGASVMVQIGDGAWQRATVVRLKSCFGRGLLILPPGEPAPKDGETFLLKFASGSGGASR
jgi:hypothetical protein